MFKKILIFLFVLMVVFINVYAHPGRTDEYGGHYNHSTGEYHYHHGESAHQHPNGVCPYDDSYSNYAIIEKEYDYEEYEESISVIVEDEESDDTPIYKIILRILVCFWWAIIPMLLGILDLIKKKRTNKNDIDK